MVKTLETHFTYWDDKIEAINESAFEALKELEAKNSITYHQYREFLDAIKRLNPRDNEERVKIKKLEKMLLNLYR